MTMPRRFARSSSYRPATSRSASAPVCSPSPVSAASIRAASRSSSSSTTATTTPAAARSRRPPAAGRLALTILDSLIPGVGHARRAGMDAACRRLLDAGVPDGLIATRMRTRASRPTGWPCSSSSRPRGARAIGGRIELDPHEAALLPPGVLASRRDQARKRLASIRAAQRRSARSPRACEHHQFSGASLAVTARTYQEVGGLPDVEALEDEALQRLLEERDIPIVRSKRVRWPPPPAPRVAHRAGWRGTSGTPTGARDARSVPATSTRPDSRGSSAVRSRRSSRHARWPTRSARSSIRSAPPRPRSDRSDPRRRRGVERRNRGGGRRRRRRRPPGGSPAQRATGRPRQG